MKKITLMLALLVCSVRAQAYELVYFKAASTAAVAGVTCSTGTAINITGSISGYASPNLLNHRLKNTDSTYKVWIGFLSTVSSSTLANLGERLDAGQDATYSAGYDPDTKAPVKIWCIAADAAGASGVILSRSLFGFK